MSVQTRIDKYWLNDSNVGRKIFNDMVAAGITFGDWKRVQAFISGHRLNGKMQRYKRKYQRLNKRHESRMIRKMAYQATDRVERAVISGASDIVLDSIVKEI